MSETESDLTDTFQFKISVISEDVNTDEQEKLV